MEDKYFSTFFKELVVQENGLIVFGSDEFKETKELNIPQFQHHGVR